MITIHTNGSKVAYGIQHFILDTIDDLTELNKNNLIKPGSTIFIINTSKYYMLNGQKAWIEINPYGMKNSFNNGSGDNENGDSNSDNESYDGGSIDDSDPIRQG